MPIPYRQVEQNFFKRLVHKGMDIFSHKKEKIGETTIVRPDFHHGTIQIDKKVFSDIIEHTCLANKYIVIVIRSKSFTRASKSQSDVGHCLSSFI